MKKVINFSKNRINKQHLRYEKSRHLDSIQHKKGSYLGLSGPDIILEKDLTHVFGKDKTFEQRNIFISLRPNSIDIDTGEEELVKLIDNIRKYKFKFHILPMQIETFPKLFLENRDRYIQTKNALDKLYGIPENNRISTNRFDMPQFKAIDLDWCGVFNKPSINILKNLKRANLLANTFYIFITHAACREQSCKRLVKKLAKSMLDKNINEEFLFNRFQDKEDYTRTKLIPNIYKKIFSDLGYDCSIECVTKYTDSSPMVCYFFSNFLKTQDIVYGNAQNNQSETYARINVG